MAVVSKSELSGILAMNVTQTNLLKDIFKAITDENQGAMTVTLEKMQPFSMRANDHIIAIDKLVKRHKLEGFSNHRIPNTGDEKSNFAEEIKRDLSYCLVGMKSMSEAVADMLDNTLHGDVDKVVKIGKALNSIAKADPKRELVYKTLIRKYRLENMPEAPYKSQRS